MKIKPRISNKKNSWLNDIKKIYIFFKKDCDGSLCFWLFLQNEIVLCRIYVCELHAKLQMPIIQFCALKKCCYECKI